MSDRSRERNAKSRTRSLLSAGNQNQLVNSPKASIKPAIRKANLQPPQSAKRAITGTLMAAASTFTDIMPPTAWARLSGEITSASVATALGGSIPPPSPVATLRTKRTSRLGANAEPITETHRTRSPASMTGRRPNESDKGPTEATETAHAAKVAVASCPATGTEISRSPAISTSNGGRKSAAFCPARTASETMVKNHSLFTSLCSACADRVPMLVTPLPAYRPRWPPAAAG